jgi:biopolymer transport protein TolR
MVTAPLIQQGVKVNLPPAKAAPIEAKETKIVLSIDKGRHVFIGEAEVPIDQLEQKLKTNAKVQADKELYLQADTDVNYGTVIQVMAAAQRAGIPFVGMITDPLTPPKRR